MSKKLLIDASHSEEARVAIVHQETLEEFDSETVTKKQLKSNIYLAKVIRVEPSLQAAFVEYGGDRQGFLPFSEIHPDYFQIPVSDRANQLDETENDEDTVETIRDENGVEIPTEAVDVIDDAPEKTQREKDTPPHFKYKIQEVIKRRQILLVQITKEERGNKGAALTTYLSLAGRYCVLMPNAGRRTGGISRKIDNSDDRKRLRTILDSLEIPEGMSLIVRTAGQARNKSEIKRDYEYLLKLWSGIRETTMQSIAPCLIHEEGDLITRAIRDMYDRDIDEILIEGDAAYKHAKTLMKKMMPSHAKKVQAYKDLKLPLFHKFRIEEQIDEMMHPVAKLPSGGYVVINPTEALVSIDVNSGRATRERNLDDTALKTNIEAAQEIARQIRLRDMAGLIVIDFIDMYENKHAQQVERKLKEALGQDRARIQVGKISQFGLLEMSRQRLRPSLLETHNITCPHCSGTGHIRSSESLSLQVLRAIEIEGIEGKATELRVTVPEGSDLYLLNQKRNHIVHLEQRFNVSVLIERDITMPATSFKLEVVSYRDTDDDAEDVIEPVQNNTVEEPQKNKQRQKRKTDRKKPAEKIEEAEAVTTEQSDEKPKKPSRRNKPKKVSTDSPQEATTNDVESTSDEATATEESQPKKEGRNRRNNRRNRFKTRGRNNRTDDESQSDQTKASAEVIPLEAVKSSDQSTQGPAKKPRPRKSEEDNSNNSENSDGESKPKKGRRNWLRRLLDA